MLFDRCLRFHLCSQQFTVCQLLQLEAGDGKVHTPMNSVCLNQEATRCVDSELFLFCPQKPLFIDTHCGQDLTANYFSVVYLYTHISRTHFLVSWIFCTPIQKLPGFFFFTLFVCKFRLGQTICYNNFQILLIIIFWKYF